MGTTALEDRLSRDARSGDERALAAIFDEYHQPLYRYCLSILGNRQDAEDALQETMVKALRSLPGETREVALRPWLYRIAHNEAIELIRRRRESVSLEDAEPAAGEGLAEQVETRERLRLLLSDLGALPDRQRGALLMREAAGLEFDEIGAALDTTPAAARQTVYEARIGLREMDAGRDMACAEVTRALSDGDRRVRRRRELRAHLRDCSECRDFEAAIDRRRTDLAAIAPLPAAAAAALLHGAFASGGGAAAGGAAAGGAGGGTGVGTIAAGGAAKSIGTATLLKGAATVAVVAAIGVGAADRGGPFHHGGGRAETTPAASPPEPSEASPSSEAPRPTGTSPEAGEGRPAGGSTKGGDPAASKPRNAVGQAAAKTPRDGAPQPEAAAAPPAGESAPEAAAAPAEAPTESATAEPHGRGHEKEPSANAAHGQETAAAKHAAHEAKPPPAAKAEGHPTHPAHPEKPAESPPPEAAAPASETPSAAADEEPAGHSEKEK